MAEWYEKIGGSVGQIVLSATAAAGATGSAVHVQDRFSGITLTALPGAGGTINIQYTFDSNYDVNADEAGANWQSWEAGAVGSVTSVHMPNPPTAFRSVAVTADGSAQLTGTRR